MKMKCKAYEVCHTVITRKIMVGVAVCCMAVVCGCNNNVPQVKMPPAPTLYYQEDLSALSLDPHMSLAEEAGAEMEEENCIVLYLQRAEQRELQTNQELGTTVNNRIVEYAQEASKGFVEGELYNQWNNAKCWFKNERKRNIFYFEKLLTRLHPHQFEQTLQDEIRLHCLSLIHTRVRVLSQLVGNGNIPDSQKVALKYKILELKGIGSLISSRMVLKDEFSDFFEQLPQAACTTKRLLDFTSFYEGAETLWQVKDRGSKEKLVTSLEQEIGGLTTASLQERLKEDGYASLREASDKGTTRFYSEIKKLLELI